MYKFFLTALLAALVPLAHAADVLEVSDAWVRATVSSTGTGAFMRLKSRTDARLVEVRSPVAGVAEVHEMTLVNDVMKMRALDTLPLPAGKTVELKPGGSHVMLMDLSAPLKAGDSVPLTLVIEDQDGKRRTVDLTLPVRPLGHAMPQHR
ncbi:MAG TPA: copper chaperone PCu(A)C [Macromonas sp.]|nr:copper chaperone PCu(A)C [Macromonas sp.]